jgi:hypothetical protein
MVSCQGRGHRRLLCQSCWRTVEAWLSPAPPVEGVVDKPRTECKSVVMLGVVSVLSFGVGGTDEVIGVSWSKAPGEWPGTLVVGWSALGLGGPRVDESRGDQEPALGADDGPRAAVSLANRKALLWLKQFVLR